MEASPVSVVGHQCEKCDQIDYIIESMKFIPLGRVLLIIWEKSYRRALTSFNCSLVPMTSLMIVQGFP